METSHKIIIKYTVINKKPQTMQVFIWKSKKKVCIQLKTMPTTNFSLK